MMSIFTHKLKIAGAVFLLLALFVPTSLATAQVNPLDPACEGASGATLCQDKDGQDPEGDNDLYGPDGILTKVVDILSIMIGIAAVIVIMGGGLKYILASGDPNNINAAKNAVMFALIGLGVAAASQALVILVLSRL